MKLYPTLSNLRRSLPNAALPLSIATLLLSAILCVVSFRTFTTAATLARAVRTLEASVSDQKARITDLESRAHLLTQTADEMEAYDIRIKTLGDELKGKADRESVKALSDQIRDDEKALSDDKVFLLRSDLGFLEARVKLLDSEIGGFAPSKVISGATINERLAGIEGQLQKVEDRLQIQPE